MAEVLKMPRMSDTMTEGVIVSWLKKVGDKVKAGDILAEVETDKATMELENYTDGFLLHIGVQEGQSVAVNGVIAVVGKEGEDYKTLLAQETANAPAVVAEAKAEPVAQAAPAAPSATIPQPVAAPVAIANSDTDSRVKSSPLAKKIALEKGIAINAVAGSGDNGRIVKRDVENFINSGGTAVTKTVASTTPSVQGSFEDVPVSQMRKTIARRLSESKFTAPHFYLTIDINMGRAIEARTTVNNFLGAKVSFNDIVIKAVAAALKKHTKVNASWLGDKIRYYNYVNIGVAIAVDEGLVVPVVRNADLKGLAELSTEVRAFADKSKTKKLQPTDFEGNTFTISNLGMFGIDEFTAIINPPDACIMAVGSIRETVIVENGEMKPGKMMKVTLSCDHRVVDGVTGAQFLQTFKQYLEEPLTILA
ncbi:MAG: pyruvate dehydrogenase complex dihydrolipoamide acetyltransferase [Bacteroidetes bacterium]|nr:pyruvate dehydrogenase complex dihydrolipoamide acetyltransferase [Bacteroidota bacterium]